MSNATSPGAAAPRAARQRAQGLALGWWKYLVPLALLAVWQLAATLGWVDEYILPAPTVVFTTFIDLLASGELLRDVGISALRVAQGFALAAVAGLGLGLAMGLSKKFNAASDFLLKILKPIPPIAWIRWRSCGSGWARRPRCSSFSSAPSFPSSSTPWTRSGRPTGATWTWRACWSSSAAPSCRRSSCRARCPRS